MMEFITSNFEFLITTRRKYETFPLWPYHPLMQHIWGQKVMMTKRKLQLYKDTVIKTTDENDSLGVCRFRLTAAVS